MLYKLDITNDAIQNDILFGKLILVVDFFYAVPIIFFFCADETLLLFLSPVLPLYKLRAAKKEAKPAKSHGFNQFNLILIASYEKMTQPKHQLSTVIMGSMLTASQRTMGTILRVWMRRREREINAFSFIICIDEMRRSRNKFSELCAMAYLIVWLLRFQDGVELESSEAKPNKYIWIFDISIWCNPVIHRKPYNFAPLKTWFCFVFSYWCVMISIEALQGNTCAAVCSWQFQFAKRFSANKIAQFSLLIFSLWPIIANLGSV